VGKHAFVLDTAAAGVIIGASGAGIMETYKEAHMKISWKGRLLGACLVVGLAALGFVTLEPQTVGAQATPGESQLLYPREQFRFPDNGRVGPMDLGLTDPALIGAIDIHAHIGPSSGWNNNIQRAIDIVDEGKFARLRGMRGFAIKEHHGTESAGMAYVMRKLYPELEVYGRFAMNFAVGGVNMGAVYHFANVQGGWGRIVEMPTTDAEYRILGGPRGEGSDRNPESQETMEGSRPYMLWMPPGAPKYVSVSRNGELLPEVKFVIAQVAKMKTIQSFGKLSLSTGHSSGAEDVLVMREAAKYGLNVVSPHHTDMNEAQLKEYLNLGGYVGIHQDGFTAEAVRKVGAEHVIASSDVGFRNAPFHTDVLAMMAKNARAGGLTEREINLAFKENPAKFLNLPPDYVGPVRPSTD